MEFMNIKRMLKILCAAALVVLVIIGLGPSKWTPRSGLGWEIDHFAGYFVIALMFCLAWPRPLVVAGVLIVFAAALEALQAIPPDRSSNVFAALYSSAGVLAGALLSELFIRARKRTKPQGL
jgi:VanZ family protein